MVGRAGSLDAHHVALATIHGIGVYTRRKGLDYDLLRKLYREARQVQPCYVVTNLDEPGTPREFTGGQLTQEGLAIVIRDKPGAALVTYRQKK